MSAKLRLHAAPATFVSFAVILAFSAAALVALSSASTSRSRAAGARRRAPAASPQPKCGDKITADTTLHHDLIDCTNNGIVIGADGITLDLNGHTIDGDGKLLATCPRNKICDVGVVSLGHDGVTVVGGSLGEFALGGLVGNASRPHLLGLSSSGNRFAGAEIFNSPRTLVRDSKFVGNGLHTDQAGLGLHDSPDGRFLRNSFGHNGDIGMFVDGSNRNRIEGNVFSRNPEAAILMEEGSGNEMRRNHLSRNGEGFTVAGNRNVIARNRVSDSRAPGVAGVGIFVAAGRDNVIARNVVGGSSKAGIVVGLFPRETGGHPSGVATVIRGNRLRRGNLDGLLVRKTALGTVLRRNRAHGSKDDGFDVESRTATLAGNSAVGNADLGIEAVRGVIDGGGNRASGNGDPRQCTNIACR
jgi:parallel beta-helix repeat protein